LASITEAPGLGPLIVELDRLETRWIARSRAAFQQPYPQACPTRTGMEQTAMAARKTVENPPCGM